MATHCAVAWPRDVESRSANLRSVPKTTLARPLPTRQTGRKGRLNFRVFVKSCGWFRALSQLRQHAGEHLQSQVLLVAQAIGAALDDADLVVESFDEAERDLVLGSAVGGDAIPMALDHLGELLEARQALPSQRRTPLVEELSCPRIASVVPQLPEAQGPQADGVREAIYQEVRRRASAVASGAWSGCSFPPFSPQPESAVGRGFAYKVTRLGPLYWTGWPSAEVLLGRTTEQRLSGMP